MNRWSIKIGLGIAIYLSSFIVDSRSSLATSLIFSDRYELTQLDDDPLFSPRTSSFPSIFNLNYIEIQNRYVLDNFSLYEVQTTQSSASFEEIQDLFSASESNVRVETATSESENSFSLLDSLNTAVRSLQFDSLQDNTFANPNIIILPQVAYENIYRGLYDFDIEITDVPSGNSSASNPRTVENSIPEELLISRESAIEYSPAFGATQPTRDFYSDNASSGNYYTGSREDSDRALLNEYITSGKISSLLETEGYENSNKRFNSAASTLSTRVEDIAVESQFKINKFSTSSPKKDPKLQEIDKQIAEQQKKNEEERKKLLDRLEREQEERERKQEQERMRLEKQRENRLRKIENQQRQQLERQRAQYGNN